MYVPCTYEEVAHPPTTSGVEAEEATSMKEVTDPPEVENVDTNANRWSHNDVLSLIDAYRQTIERFKSSSVRNDIVWKCVADQVKSVGGNFTPKQCEFKFKYLKKKYQAKVDNMKATQTGASAVYFQYFNEFHELFGKKPNIQPVAVASSSRGGNINLGDDDDDDDDKALEASEVTVSEVVRGGRKEGKEPPKKKTKFEKVVSEFIKMSKTKEEEKEHRHKELLQVQREAIITFSEKMDKLIDKL